MPLPTYHDVPTHRNFASFVPTETYACRNMKVELTEAVEEMRSMGVSCSRGSSRSSVPSNYNPSSLGVSRTAYIMSLSSDQHADQVIVFRNAGSYLRGDRGAAQGKRGPETLWLPLVYITLRNGFAE